MSKVYKSNDVKHEIASKITLKIMQITSYQKNIFQNVIKASSIKREVVNYNFQEES